MKIADLSGSAWSKAGAMIGGLLIFVWSHFDIESKVDDGKTEQRVHWQQDRQHKDSLEIAADALHTRQNDTMIALLKKHLKVH